MKTCTIFLIGILSLYHACAQPGLSAEKWREDLRFLQNTVHRDYPFLFKKTTAKDFDAAVEQLYQDIPGLQEHEIVAGLARIVASFQYGHTALGFRGGPVRFHQLPLNLYQFSDGIYVQAVHKTYDRVLGARVLKVEGVPVEEALKAIRPNVWDSLGEACWRSDQKEKAIEYYNKAIALDPTGVTGDNARNMLRQIQGEK